MRNSFRLITSLSRGFSGNLNIIKDYRFYKSQIPEDTENSRWKKGPTTLFFAVMPILVPRFGPFFNSPTFRHMQNIENVKRL